MVSVPGAALSVKTSQSTNHRQPPFRVTQTRVDLQARKRQLRMSGRQVGPVDNVTACPPTRLPSAPGGVGGWDGGGGTSSSLRRDMNFSGFRRMASYCSLLLFNIESFLFCFVFILVLVWVFVFGFCWWWWFLLGFFLGGGGGGGVGFCLWLR